MYTVNIIITMLGETPVLLVGLVDGGVELVEVLRDSGASSSPPETQTTRIETKGKHDQFRQL